VTSAQICKIGPMLLRTKFALRRRASPNLVSQIESEQAGKLTHLRAQLRLANKLIEFTFWHDNLRVELTRRISAANAVENIIKKIDGSSEVRRT
jgi:hypothetical protein